MSEKKPDINIIFIGHTDSGKSTTVQHLVNGNIEHKKERVTVDLSFFSLPTPKYQFTLIDAPGHLNYIKNTITGLSQADAACLFVSAAIGEFEVGISSFGLTRQHLLLALTFGIKKLIIAINKMDDLSVSWNQARFDEIVKELSTFIKNEGYKIQGVVFVPISGWTGENLKERDLSNLSWFSGPTLFDAFLSLQPPPRFPDKPLRFCVQSFCVVPILGTILLGKIQTGSIRIGDWLTTSSPSSHPIKITPQEVSYFQKHRVDVEYAEAGEIVGITMRNLRKSATYRGMVFGDKNDPPREAEYFITQLIILNHKNGIEVGFTPVVDCHTAHVACKIVEIVERLGKGDLYSSKLITGDGALVKMVPTKSFCVDTFARYPFMGRIAIRDNGVVVAVGIIKQVQFKETKT